VALHQYIQNLLLFGVRLQARRAAEPAPAPKALRPLIDSVQSARREFDQRAVSFGHRYRSGFWMIYLLSAFAVLCAVLPLALGWDSASHTAHRFSGVWAVVEVCVIVTVSAIYWRGHHSDWQGEWLSARTTAELTSYLPMIAPLLDFSGENPEPNWYLRIFDPGEHNQESDDVTTLCRNHEAEARRLLQGIWSDPEFPDEFARWSISVLDAQQCYHERVAARQHALLHRSHRVTIVLFILTAIAAMSHLVIHTLWLSLITTFFPALAASLHGAIAQSESYRLETSSERLAEDLRDATRRIAEASRAEALQVPRELKAAVEAAVALILEEHQDWQMLVRPHHLPLA
jgi:hypothetical protein